MGLGVDEINLRCGHTCFGKPILMIIHFFRMKRRVISQSAAMVHLPKYFPRCLAGIHFGSFYLFFKFLILGQAVPCTNDFEVILKENYPSF